MGGGSKKGGGSNSGGTPASSSVWFFFKDTKPVPVTIFEHGRNTCLHVDSQCVNIYGCFPQYPFAQYGQFLFLSDKQVGGVPASNFAAETSRCIRYTSLCQALYSFSFCSASNFLALIGDPLVHVPPPGLFNMLHWQPWAPMYKPFLLGTPSSQAEWRRRCPS